MILFKINFKLPRYPNKTIIIIKTNTEHALLNEKKTFLWINLMYIIALSLIAAITIFSQFLIQDYLSNQVKDSRLINISSRLRTYSQTLSKTALLIDRGENLEINTKDFLNTFKQFEKSHKALISGSEFWDLPENDREDLEEMYKIVEGPYLKITNASDSLIALLYNETHPKEHISKYVDVILSYEQSYLLGMELIVFDYDRFSRNSVKKLKNIEYYLSGFVLVMLVLEIIFIFYPLSRKLRRIIRDLFKSQREYKVLAKQVKESNNTLKISLKELRELTYAIEKANFYVKTDSTGLITYANDKYCHVSKYPLNELIGKPLFYNNQGQEESIIYKHIKNGNRKSEVWQGEIFDHASDNTGFWLDIVLMPVLDDTGYVYQYLAIGTDITKRKNTESKLNLLTEEKLIVQQQQQTIKSYSIIMGQERERKRVAAEIHDGIGQMLTSMRMRIEMIENQYPNMANEMKDIHQLSKAIIDESRRICADLLPNVLDDFGLKSAINELIKTVSIDSGLQIDIEEELLLEFLEKEVQISVFRIFQESLNNIMKHAQASQIHIFAENCEESLSMIIQDDGKGFRYDEKKMLEKEFARLNSGLRNMKERTELLGGEILIDSVIGKGTTIRLQIPLG